MMKLHTVSLVVALLISLVAHTVLWVFCEKVSSTNTSKDYYATKSNDSVRVTVVGNKESMYQFSKQVRTPVLRSKVLKGPQGAVSARGELRDDVLNDNTTAFSGVLRVPTLIKESLPEIRYTADAIDAGIQGRFEVQVMIDTEGRVTQAKLKQPIGAGMDERIMEGIFAAKFVPALNSRGEVAGAPATVIINLELE